NGDASDASDAPDEARVADDNSPEPTDPSEPGTPDATDPTTNEADQTEPVRDDASDNSQDSAPLPPQPGGDGASSTVKAGEAYRPRLFTVDGLGQGTPGRRSRALGSTGRRVGAAPGRGNGALHLVETLRAAAERHVSQEPGAHDGRLTLHASDLRTAVREGREANLLLFCVD